MKILYQNNRIKVEGAEKTILNPEETKLTKLAFRRRFTLAEKSLFEGAADSDPTMRVLLKDQEAASYIDLRDNDTVEALNYLVSKEILTQERADEILNTPVKKQEAV